MLTILAFAAGLVIGSIIGAKLQGPPALPIIPTTFGQLAE